MTHEELGRWLEGHERLWRTPGTDGLAALFTEGASYRASPYEDPSVGEFRDLWVIELAPDGRCRAFEEWPFFPGQPLRPG